jgi:hypothetical protein
VLRYLELSSEDGVVLSFTTWHGIIMRPASAIPYVAVTRKYFICAAPAFSVVALLTGIASDNISGPLTYTGGLSRPRSHRLMALSDCRTD